MIGQLELWAADVHVVNVDKGWFEEERTFGAGIALLHSEVSEALEAFRDHGLADATEPKVTATDYLPKPEGVGSELADVLIRCLDMHTRHGHGDLDGLTVSFLEEVGTPPAQETFADELALLHGLISLYFRSEGKGTVAPVIVATDTIATRSGLDLAAEYHRKLAYNRTRPHKHGGRTL